MSTTDNETPQSQYVTAAERVICDAAANLLSAIAERIVDSTVGRDLDKYELLNMGAVRGKLDAARWALNAAMIGLDVNAENYHPAPAAPAKLAAVTPARAWGQAHGGAIVARFGEAAAGTEDGGPDATPEGEQAS